ncbi:hypothetical protein KFU94_56965 [Chloroflexi bacterium TSY]|nr:hypothetical protein [Chloroflexi bacterium TSY]
MNHPNVVQGNQEQYETSYAYDRLNNLIQSIDPQGNVKSITYDSASRKLAMNDPDMGIMTYTYDDVGNLLESTDAKGQVVRYTYDAGNRPITESWEKHGEMTPMFTYHYDENISPLHPNAQNTFGKLAYTSYASGSVHYSYDPRGNVIGQSRRYDDEGLTFITKMSYDSLDRVVKVVYSDGASVAYEYNDQELLERIPGIVDNIDYDAAGQVIRINHANGAITNQVYDVRLRLQHQTTVADEATLQDLAYTFDRSSNIVSIVDDRLKRTPENDRTQRFAYDSLYRLTSATGAYGAINYSYDNLGNMIAKTSTSADARLNIGNMIYGQNGAGPHALTSVGNVRYQYDANGNRKQGAETEYRWNPRNWLESAIVTFVTLIDNFKGL